MVDDVKMGKKTGIVGFFQNIGDKIASWFKPTPPPSIEIALKDSRILMPKTPLSMADVENKFGTVDKLKSLDGKEFESAIGGTKQPQILKKIKDLSPSEIDSIPDDVKARLKPVQVEALNQRIDFLKNGIERVDASAGAKAAGASVTESTIKANSKSFWEKLFSKSTTTSKAGTSGWGSLTGFGKISRIGKFAAIGGGIASIGNFIYSSSEGVENIKKNIATTDTQNKPTPTPTSETDAKLLAAEKAALASFGDGVSGGKTADEITTPGVERPATENKIA